MSKYKFDREYLNKIPPQTLLDWLEDFANQLDCPPPEPPREIEHRTDIEYFKSQGAWETQWIILRKLRYAIRVERAKNDTQTRR